MPAPDALQPEKAKARLGPRHRKCNSALDPNLRNSEALSFEAALRQRIIGQDEAIDAVVEMYEIFISGLNPPHRPISNMLFLGPTGTGKTRVVEGIGEALFGSSDAMIKVDCGEYQHEHEIAKLLGSPPGYVGHAATPPLLSQERLNQWHTDKLKLSLLLFDEIEKAHEALWQLLLSILDKATITLGDNRRVDFSRCMVFMTSNLGATEMAALTTGGLGFAPKRREPVSKVEENIARVAIEAARRRFSPEFMNRIDRTVVFKSLRYEHLEKILDIELRAMQELIGHTETPFRFVCTPSVKRLLLDEGTDPRYGARPLKRAIEHNITFPLANLVASGQIESGDGVTVDLVDGIWKFAAACSCEACQCGDSASCCRGARECGTSQAEKSAPY